MMRPRLRYVPLRFVTAAFTLCVLACSSATPESGFRDGEGSPTEPSGSGGFGGSPAADGSAGDAGRCEPNFTGVVRDFNDDHPDFEKFVGNGETGLVGALLGADHKPVYAPTGPTQSTTGKTNFDQWYRNVPGVNVPVTYTLPLVPGAGGMYTFESSQFFPIDGLGFGNQGRAHNYHFTFELHTEFVYRGGEIFTFSGDDDLWIFVNAHLAIDLGGVHDAKPATIEFDARAAELGLAPGGRYEISVFQAERHTPGSNFRIDTSVEFSNCDAIVR